MKKTFKALKWLLPLSGLLISILGIAMLFTPLNSLTILAVFIGIAMLISGIAEIASFCGNEKENCSPAMLADGILSTVFGIWVTFGHGAAAITDFLPFVFSAWIMSSNILRIIGTKRMKPQGPGAWRLTLTFGVLGAAFGFLLLFNPIFSTILVSCTLAVMLISYGIGSIAIFFHLNKLCVETRNELAI